ncbi:uncharacterized protein MELLADRAFT_94043 [Melampsora larici-populina 98AG31]|uniref:Uncharacterized protein n=1 Tax=Melampsora larici-populina (strain 98AG31 / pathotype 3-4-7) TaxID=747676 RepID=F4S676_MELLP|nr:uncharacterized protein MELLADRAFT_94043 [Melampsora larici-populina 98AG31]EGF99891.1 hypothetical protein MELLADRAFT_94043 [Melampsora larici-populina 98AG31]
MHPEHFRNRFHVATSDRLRGNRDVQPPLEYSDSRARSRQARQNIPAVASFFSSESAERDSFNLMPNFLASSMVKKIKTMFLIYWAMIIVTLDQRICRAVHLSKSELGSTSEHFSSETSPESIRAEGAASRSIHNAQIISPADFPPHPCNAEKEIVSHTTKSGPTEADKTTSSSQDVGQHIYQQSPMSPRDDPTPKTRFAAKQKSTLQDADQNVLQGSHPIFSLGGDFQEIHADPAYTTPSMHHQFSSSGEVNGMGQPYLEPYSYSGYPLQQNQYYTMQHGFHVPPPLVDSLSGITYVPYYPAVSISSPLYTHFSSSFQPSMIYPPIPAYPAPRPLYWQNQNNQPYGFTNSSPDPQVELKNPRPENSMDIPLQSDGRHTALNPSKTHGPSAPHGNPYPARSPESAREKQSQTTKLDKHVKETDIESNIEVPQLKRKLIADQPPVRKVQLKQEEDMDNRDPPSTTDKQRADISGTSISDLKWQDISGHSHNNVDERDLSQLKERRLRRPHYSGSAKSKQHVIAQDAGFGQAEKVLIGENWAASPTRNILMHWSAEQGQPEKSTTPRPSGEILKFEDQQDSHIRQETLNMDLWIRQLKDVEASPTFNTRKDLYNYEKNPKDFALESVTPIASENQPSNISEEVSRRSPALNWKSSREADVKTSKTEPKVRREDMQNDQNLKKGILRHSKTAMPKHTPLVSIIRESNPSLKGTPEVKRHNFEGIKRFGNTLTTETPAPPDLAFPQEKHPQKNGFLGGPWPKKISHEGITSRIMRKYDHPNIVEKENMEFFDSSLEKNTQENAQIKKKVKCIQPDDNQK